MNTNQVIYLLAVSLPGFLLGIVCHEAAHAYMAYRFGDPTAKSLGRLTLNPSVHYDLFGTIIFPILGVVMGGWMFGWAKPVPIDTRRFKNIRSGIFWVSFAGPLANLMIMVVAAFLYALLNTKVSPSFSYLGVFSAMLYHAIQINVILAVFNLIPLPPLDGSKMVSSMLSYQASLKFEELQRYSFLIFLVLMVTPILSYILTPALVVAGFITNAFIYLLH